MGGGGYVRDASGTVVQNKYISTFLGPNGIRFAPCRFRGQKIVDLQGPPLPMSLVMDVHKQMNINNRHIDSYN